MHESDDETKTVAPQSSGGGFAFAAALLGNLLLAFGPWMVRLADTGPVAAAFWRLTLAAPLLALLVLFPLGGKRGTGHRISPALFGVIGLAGLFFAADLASWHTGIIRTRLANATLFGNITSFTFALYGFLIARRLPGRNQAIALLLAAVGVGLLLGRSYELSPQHLVGDLLCILAGLWYTGYLIAIERARSVLQPLPTLLVATLAGIPPLLLFALMLGEPVWPHDWTPLLALAIGSQVIGQGLMVYAIGHLQPVVLGLTLLTQPVVAAAIGWIAYDERLGTVDAIGAVAVAVALVLVRLPDRRAALDSQRV